MILKTGVSRTISLLALLACSTGSIARQPLDAQPAPPSSNGGILTLHASTHLVVLDVSVIDWKGDPVTGLAKENFHVSEDGRPQTIRNFEERGPVDPAEAAERLAALANTLPPNTFTNLKAVPPSGSINVFVLNELMDMSPPAMELLHRQMIDTIKGAPGTPFLIFHLDTSLHMVQGMTTDTDALLAATERMWKDAQFVPGGVSYLDSARRRKVLTPAMGDLEKYLAAIPGKKNMLLLTSGIQPTLDLNALEDFGKLKVPGFKPLPIGADPELRNYFCDLEDLLHQGRIVLYRFYSDGDRLIVNHGFGCVGYYDPTRTIAEIVSRESHYYTVSYVPTNEVWNGHYRNIHLDMSGDGRSLWKGITTIYRPGYFGTPDDGSVQTTAAPPPSLNAESPAMQKAMGMGAAEPTDLVFEASLTSSSDVTTDPTGPPPPPPPPGNYLSESLRTAGYRSYAVRYAIRANQLKLLQEPNQAAYADKIEVAAVLYDSQGKPVNSKKSKVAVTFPSLADPRIQTAAVTANLTIQVPAKGSYFLRLGVRDTATDRVGALEIPVARIPPPAK